MGKSFARIIAAPADGHDRVCASLPNGNVAVASADELRRWLRRIAAECLRPLLAEVVRADGDRLTVGLGRPSSFLTYIPADENPPYFSALGDGAVHEEVNFDCHGESSFYAARTQCRSSWPWRWRVGSQRRVVCRSPISSRGRKCTAPKEQNTMSRVEPPYFPRSTFGDEAAQDDFMQQWFGKHLRSMAEPRLYLEASRDTIRLLTLPTFHEPRLVRFDRHGTATQLIAKQTDGRGGYGRGRLTIDETVDLPLSIFDDVTTALDAAASGRFRR